MSRIKRRAGIPLLALVLMFHEPAAHADCPRTSEFDQIASAVTEGFYDPTFRGLDWGRDAWHARGLKSLAMAMSASWRS